LFCFVFLWVMILLIALPKIKSGIILMNNKGFVLIIVLIVVGTFAVAGGVTYYFSIKGMDGDDSGGVDTMLDYIDKTGEGEIVYEGIIPEGEILCEDSGYYAVPSSMGGGGASYFEEENRYWVVYQVADLSEQSEERLRSEIEMHGESVLANLEGLSCLKRLDLHGLDIKTLNSLPTSLDLIELDISGTNVSDLSPLVNFPNLTKLYIGSTLVVDLSPLEKLENIGHLDLTSTWGKWDSREHSGFSNVNDFSPLGELTSLRSLWLRNTSFSDADFVYITTIVKLDYLDLDSTSISSLLPLGVFEDLATLSIGNTNIKNLNGISPLKKLRQLYVSDIDPLSIGELVYLKDLWELSLHRTGVSDLSPLSGLNNLEYLRIYGGSVSDVSPLANMENLQYLAISNSPLVSDISSLSSNKNLISIDISCTEVSDISSLASMKDLTYVNIYDTPVSDISSLFNLGRLSTVSLSATEASLSQCEKLERKIGEGNVNYCSDLGNRKRSGCA
jgi:hypothetical protein